MVTEKGSLSVQSLSANANIRVLSKRMTVIRINHSQFNAEATTETQRRKGTNVE